MSSQERLYIDIAAWSRFFISVCFCSLRRANAAHSVRHVLCYAGSDCQIPEADGSPVGFCQCKKIIRGSSWFLAAQSHCTTRRKLKMPNAVCSNMAFVSFPSIIAQVALLLPCYKLREILGAVVNLTPFRAVKNGIVAYRFFSTGFLPRDAGAIWLCDTKIDFLLWQHCSRCQRQLQDKMPGAFQAGAKERLVCGFVVPSCNHFCSRQKQDVTEDKGLRKKRVAEDDEIELQEAGGARRDGREGLEKKRVIESEGSGLKEAGGCPPEARRDGREEFGKEEGDWGRREWIPSRSKTWRKRRVWKRRGELRAKGVD